MYSEYSDCYVYLYIFIIIILFFSSLSFYIVSQNIGLNIELNIEVQICE